MPQPPSSPRWFPSVAQLQNPEKVETAFRQVLTQLYELTDRLAALEGTSAKASTGAPPGSGPTDTMLLGLRVAPVDTRTLANGAALKYDKTAGNFKFS